MNLHQSSPKGGGKNQEDVTTWKPRKEQEEKATAQSDPTGIVAWGRSTVSGVAGAKGLLFSEKVMEVRKHMQEVQTAHKWKEKGSDFNTEILKIQKSCYFKEQTNHLKSVMWEMGMDTHEDGWMEGENQVSLPLLMGY